MTIAVLVFDLDGVLRHFDDGRMTEIERDHGLEPGRLARVAFNSLLLRSLVVGRSSRAQWVDAVEASVGAAGREWLLDRGTLDVETVAVARAVKGRYRLGLLTNGTDETRFELETTGLLDVFDHVFVSAELELAKPDPAVFERVSDALQVEPGEIAFVDDTLENVMAAHQAGWRVHRFTNRSALIGWIETLSDLPLSG